MNNRLTEIICILDRSGSMGGLEGDTIGGYNAFLDKQAAMDGELSVTTVLFDDQYELLCSGVPADRARLDGERYFVRGCTALNDAVGKTILDVGARLARTPEAERPGTVIVVVTTDGLENASREFTTEKVREMITHQRRKYNWEFLFFGANIDSAETARSMGIRPDQAADFKPSPAGVSEMMCCMEQRVSKMRKRG